MAGRITTTSKLVFIEDPATTEPGHLPKTVTLMLQGDVTEHRTILVPDSDGYLLGVKPGFGLEVSKGGTGLISIPNNCFPVGSGTDQMYTTNPPVNQNDILLFDKEGTGKWQSAPLDLSGIEATTARNLTNNFGVYSSKLGSELRFKGLAVTGGLLTIGDNGQVITIGFSPQILQTIEIQSSQIVGTFDIATKTTGILGVDRGGLGTTNLPADQIILGNGTSPVKGISKPSAPGQYLRANGDNTGYEWGSLGLTEQFGGEIRLPSNSEYIQSLYWPYNCSVDRFMMEITGGNLSYILAKNNTIISAGNITAGTPVTNILSGQTITRGDRVTLTFSNVNGVIKANHTFLMTRV